MDYTLVRQDRKSITIRVGDDGQVEVRAPLRCPRQDISRFVDANAGWIARRQAELRDRRERAQRPPASLRELDKLPVRFNTVIRPGEIRAAALR